MIFNSSIPMKPVIRLFLKGVICAVSGCAMPTYPNVVYKMHSSCEGDVKVFIHHDTDPRERAARLDARSFGTPDAKKIAGVQAVEHYLEVTFVSGVWCRFLNGDPRGECYTASDAKTRAACEASLEEAEDLKPSHDDGF